jgi:hypothetical protein
MMKYGQFISGSAIGNILGVAGTIATFAVTNAIPLYISNNEIASTYVGIASNILSSNKDNKDQSIRMWAANVISAYAPEEIK